MFRSADWHREHAGSIPAASTVQNVNVPCPAVGYVAHCGRTYVGSAYGSTSFVSGGELFGAAVLVWLVVVVVSLVRSERSFGGSR